MPQIWLATGNPKKRGELERLLSPLGFEIHLQSEVDGFDAPPEDAPGFSGNAAIKACALARRVGGLALGDDSGLCVDALDGRPGVLSARYAGAGATDTDRNSKLLTELEGVPAEGRTARFVCAICLASGDGSILATFEGRCEGAIGQAPRGDGGFGYDPVFVPDGERESAQPRTFAQLSPDEKDRISHRGKALHQLALHLRQS